MLFFYTTSINLSSGLTHSLQESCCMNFLTPLHHNYASSELTKDVCLQIRDRHFSKRVFWRILAVLENPPTRYFLNGIFYFCGIMVFFHQKPILAFPKFDGIGHGIKKLLEAKKHPRLVRNIIRLISCPNLHILFSRFWLVTNNFTTMIG